MLRINGAFVGQRITGQQRYATEITRHLLAHPQVALLEPGTFMVGGVVRPWAWAQSLTFRHRRSVLLSLTSRAPVRHPRHLYVVHDLFPLTHPEWYTRRYLATHVPLLRATLAHACGLICVSEHTLRALDDYVDPRIPRIVAPNGVDAHRRLPTEEARRWVAAQGLPAGRYFLAVASADPRKNIDRLVSAYGRLAPSLRRDYPLVLVGGSNSHVFRESSLPGTDGFRPLGYVDDDQLLALYSLAMATVVPSLDEGFGLPVVEALSSGSKVVASDIPVFRWICGDLATYFDPAVEDDIRVALLQVVEEGGVSLDRRDRAAITKRFSWTESARSIRDFSRKFEP